MPFWGDNVLTVGAQRRGLRALVSQDGVSLGAMVANIARAAGGAFYNPSDLTSLYQSRTGGSNATSGSVVGIMLDKSNMGGRTAASFISSQPELCSNPGGPYTATTGWAAGFQVVDGTLTVVSGSLVLTKGAGDGTSPRYVIPLTCVVGRLYHCTVSGLGGTAGTTTVSASASSAGTGAIASVTASGVFTFFATATTMYAVLANSGTTGQTSLISGISIKAIPGYHAVAPSDAARPVLGTVPATGKRNLLTYSEQMDNASWSKSNAGSGVAASVTANAGTAPDGTTTADRVQLSLGGGTTSSDISLISQSNTTTGQLTHSVYLKSYDGVSSYAMQIIDATGAGQAITVTGTWQRFQVAATASGTVNYAVRLRGGQTPTNAATADVLAWGAQLETGSTATAYQQVITANQCTEAGVTTCYFLTTDGVDDWMNVTPTLNLGEQWWHVGGWRSDTAARAAFATSNSYRGALWRVGTEWIWIIPADTNTTEIATGDPSAIAVVTVQQAATGGPLTGRYNGGNGASLTPYDDSASTQGLALFSQANSAWGSGMAGRFYGGAFAPGSISTTDRALVELWAATASGTTASLLAANPAALAEAAAALGDIEPYHYWDFINDRFLFAQTTTPSRALSTTPGWSFARASTGYAETVAGTLTAFASGELRRTDKGVLIEGARTNLLLYSQDFSKAEWTKVNATVTADATTAPDGTLTADTLEATTTGPQLYQIPTLPDSTTYTVSIYLKRISGSDWAYLRFRSKTPTNFYVWVNLATQTVGSTSGSPTATTVTALANGWCRVSITGSSETGATAPMVYVSSATADAVGSAATSDTIAIWGAQCEAASFPSSYIPTTTVSATRAADVLTVSSPGVTYPLSLYAEFERVVDTGGDERVFGIGAPRTEMGTNSVDTFDVYWGATPDTGYSNPAGSLALGAVHKGAARFVENDMLAACNGVLGAQDTIASTGSAPSTIRFGSRSDSSSLSITFGYLRRAAIFNSAANDAQLVAMTGGTAFIPIEVLTRAGDEILTRSGATVLARN